MLNVGKRILSTLWSLKSRNNVPENRLERIVGLLENSRCWSCRNVSLHIMWDDPSSQTHNKLLSVALFFTVHDAVHYTIRDFGDGVGDVGGSAEITVTFTQISKTQKPDARMNPCHTRCTLFDCWGSKARARSIGKLNFPLYDIYLPSTGTGS